MPELLTKHPDATFTVLKSAGAKCGVGEPQQILKQCPKESFCSMPGGEACVYSLPQVGQMTQITKQDLAQYVCKPERKDDGPFGWVGPGIGTSGIALALGVALGAVVARRRAPS